MTAFKRDQLAAIAEREASKNLVWSLSSEADKYKKPFYVTSPGGVFAQGSWAWCGAFVRWCAVECGLDMPIKCPSKYGLTFAYVEAWQKWAQEKGFYFDNDGKFQPEPGDIVLFDWRQTNINQNDANDESHIGVHLRMNGAIYICAEGNTSNQTAIKTRASVNIQGWVRIPDHYAFNGNVVTIPLAPVNAYFSASFERAVERNLIKEGGFVDHPADKGGPTNLGITIATLSAFRGKAVITDDVRNLSRAEAKEIYHKNYWLVMNLDIVTDSRIATILFDQGVNRGTYTAAKDMQRTLNTYFGNTLVIDGDIGPKTAKAITDADKQKLIVFYVSDVQDKYNDIIRKNPSQAVFAVGWGNRTQSLLELLWA